MVQNNKLVEVLDFASDAGMKYAHYLYHTQEADRHLEVHENLLNPVQWYVAMELIEKELNNQKVKSKKKPVKIAKPMSKEVLDQLQKIKKRPEKSKFQNVPKRRRNNIKAPKDDDQKGNGESIGVPSQSQPL